ncbi:thiamine-binding protein [Pontibacillus yanchengensis]|uniref:Thiamine-binding protein n=2 Tax=Pontibacillus yanchengensis TaxID=462910 RepID=A0ACC7VKG4_9BACI|nr:YkoF family thiamine/hydroxymethylpyrimidine-binding protein [Pontibacillus yanchengensis]MYL35027.1 thiamine-binding protein [Pontibacillus yanchengensis]MYL55262.1 thiamine-binding protein [Pontibacillus yanchengensis]
MSQQCGNSRIAGCSFSVHPMTDQFVEYIKGSLKETDTSNVWMDTDEVTTTVRGEIEHVFDVTRAVFLRIAKTGVHTAFNATYSIGCPGDSAGDQYTGDIGEPANGLHEVKQHTSAKFSLYPMGGGDYMEVIYREIDRMKEKGIDVSAVHYATKLSGDVNDTFHGLEDVFRETERSGSSHTVMTVTMSANSPSQKEEQS